MDFYRACSTCKKPIGFSTKYYVCSVSTCQRNATNFAFCSLDCWDAHVPTFRHKEAWGEERRSPSAAEVRAQPAAAEPAPAPVSSPAPTRTMMPSAPRASAAPSAAEGEASDDDVLIVASKLKAYIRAKSGGMNTAGSVMEALSDRVRRLCDAAIEQARRDGRKTVMDRDF